MPHFGRCSSRAFAVEADLPTSAPSRDGSGSHCPSKGPVLTFVPAA